MTLDYKILGQLYYGPEINETPEIPGTSGYYTSVTGGIANRFVLPLSSSSEVLYSDDGATWSVGTMPTGGDWYSLTYGDGKFVSVSSSSNVAAYSTDGITWTQSTMPSSQAWLVLAYGGGKFVSIAPLTNVAAYSTDGISWTQTTIPSDKFWLSITYGNGKFVVVGYDTSSLVLYSTDGINWSESSSFPAETHLRSITYGNGRFVAIGMFNEESYYSTDGINWTQSTLPSSQVAIAYGDGKFVTVPTYSTQAAYSTDGITWTVSTIPIGDGYNSLVYGNGKFVAGPGMFANASAYSTDGINWVGTTLPFEANYGDVSYGEVNTLTEVQISIGGQGTPGSYVEITEPQVLYTVPNGTETTVTSIYVTNQDSVSRTYDLAVVPAGETLSLKHHIRWDMPVAGSDFDLANAKLTLSAGDKIYVFPSTINKVGFTAFGVEKS